jgi:hypothetical protein
MLPNVRFRSDVFGNYSAAVTRFECNEQDPETMASLEIDVPAEVGQPLTLFLAHVIAVRLVRSRDRC